MTADRIAMILVIIGLLACLVWNLRCHRLKELEKNMWRGKYYESQATIDMIRIELVKLRDYIKQGKK